MRYEGLGHFDERWIVRDKDGAFYFFTASLEKIDAIYKFTSSTPWEELQERGYAVVQVEVKEVTEIIEEK